MGGTPLHSHGRGTVQMGDWLLGILRYAMLSSRCYIEILTWYDPRIPGSTYAWRLRSAKALDGNHNTSTNIAMVLLRLAVLGLGLPTFDSIS